jgi:hypothetical protein
LKCIDPYPGRVNTLRVLFQCIGAVRVKVNQ